MAVGHLGRASMHWAVISGDDEGHWPLDYLLIFSLTQLSQGAGCLTEALLLGDGTTAVEARAAKQRSP